MLFSSFRWKEDLKLPHGEFQVYLTRLYSFFLMKCPNNIFSCFLNATVYIVMELVDIFGQLSALPFTFWWSWLLLRYLLIYICSTILNFVEADGWCSGGDGGGCLQGCDATGEHFVNCISSKWTTVFLGSKRMHFFGLNKRICLSGILFILWIFKFCLSGFFLFCEFYPVNCIFFVFSTALSFVLSTAVSLSCQLHSLCIVNCIFFCIVSCISFVLSIAFPLCFQLHFLFYCQLHFLCVVNFIYWSQSTEFSLFCHPYIFAFLLYLSIIIINY